MDYNLFTLNSSSPVREPSVSEVQAELRRVLESREFRQSRGLSKLLRYICGKALIGDPEPITEYTIAMDVLGKSQTFKENKDASVRVEVHRLRKRLADFYQSDGAGGRVRIVIPIGHYTPEFVIQESAEEAEAPGTVLEPEVEAAAGTVEPEVPVAPSEPVWESVPVAAMPEPSRWKWALKLAALVSVMAALGLAMAAVAHSSDPLDSLWRPILVSPNPTLLCIGDRAGGEHPPDDPSVAAMSVLDFHVLKSQSVLINDAVTMARFAGLLESHGKAYRVVSQSEATFADLQSGPAVLIGLANNDWTERLVGKLRFFLQGTVPGGKLIIRDREHPDRTDWNVDYSEPLLKVTKDYAVVLRVLDPKTEQTVISAAGITVFGTLAAGEFLTRREEFRKIEAVAPRGWQKMNFELVLSTDVIRGKSGHANIVAWHFW